MLRTPRHAARSRGIQKTTVERFKPGRAKGQENKAQALGCIQIYDLQKHEELEYMLMRTV